MAAATGANAIARVAAPTPLYWSPIYDTAQAAGVRYAPQPVILQHSYDSDTVTGTVAETDTWSYVLAANTFPSKARLVFDWNIIHFNNLGAIATTYKFYFGATAYAMATPSVGASASNYLPFSIHVEVIALNATNSQRVICLPLFFGSVAGGVSAPLYTAPNTGTASIDTTANVTIKCSVTHGNVSASLSSQVYEPRIVLYPSMT